jgi:Cu+-exporting ATPase
MVVAVGITSPASDPVCGMEVDPAIAPASIEGDGTRLYFCSNRCAAKYRAAPEKYQELKAANAASSPSPKYDLQAECTCPMHPEIRQAAPGNCPKCGMALESAVVTTPIERIEYTCPMHPQIVRDAPGSCPICGMALEPREVTAQEINPELVDMTRRLWSSAALAAPMLALMVSSFLPTMPMQHLVSASMGVD